MKENHQSIMQSSEELTAARVRLRKFTMDDCADILEYGSDAQTLKYLDWVGVSTIEDVKQSITTYYEVTPGVYAIELKDRKKCIGAIDLRPEWGHEKSRFGYVLNRNYWGNGYMTEALSAVLRFCFDELELNRVESCHYVGNEGSGRVMEKCGMKREGIGIQECKVKGVFHDVVHYGITRQQWNASRA